MHACRGEPGDNAREKCPHVIASHVHEQYRECGNLQTVILEVKVVMNESLEMGGEDWTCEKEKATTNNCKLNLYTCTVYTCMCHEEIHEQKWDMYIYTITHVHCMLCIVHSI